MLVIDWANVITVAVLFLSADSVVEHPMGAPFFSSFSFFPSPFPSHFLGHFPGCVLLLPLLSPQITSLVTELRV